MHLDASLLSSVFFVCSRDPHGEAKAHVGGTGFFVGVPLVFPRATSIYLVTARHVVERAAEQELLVRFNSQGGVGYLPLPGATSWTFPEDAAVDVAVLDWRARPEGIDFRYIRRGSFAPRDVVDREGVGVGDELVVAGLLAGREGRERNRPIARSGHLAAMPDEPIEDEATGNGYEAYLAEVRSTGGLSGSPVFVRNPSAPSAHAESPLYLLGLVRGHWNVSAAADASQDSVVGEQVNSGIAIVTPIDRVVEILDSAEFIRRRREADQDLARGKQDSHGNPVRSRAD